MQSGRTGLSSYLPQSTPQTSTHPIHSIDPTHRRTATRRSCPATGSRESREPAPPSRPAYRVTSQEDRRQTSIPGLSVRPKLECAAMPSAERFIVLLTYLMQLSSSPAVINLGGEIAR